jgi:predicted ATPase/transcriptional regulator with XRE-family HTH domain
LNLSDYRKAMNETNTQMFGSWVKRRRKALDITQIGLAQLVGCSESAIIKIELGQRRPSRQVAERLVESLGIPAEEQAAFLTLARGGVGSAEFGPRSAELLHSDLRTPGSVLASNLPARLTSLVGREEEIRRVRVCLLEGPRLITLVGPGGIGKTRLSLEVGSGLVGAFRDGVYFVALAPLRDAGLVASTIAQALGVREAGSQPLMETLKSYLRNREVLLILDNFEHLAEAGPLLTELLTWAPRLRIMVTSRTMLHLYGEQQFVVPPLQMPDDEYLPSEDHLGDYEAVRLFVERARLVNPGFELGGHPEQARVVAQICSRLDGLPLAIELAAARINMISPSIMLGRLESRLELLTGGPLDLPPRQQTLRNAIEWSYNLLNSGEQRLFTRLAVFVGGWTAEAAEQILDFGSWILEAEARQTQNPKSKIQNLLDGLESLISKSLLQRYEGAAGEARFGMLETIHEYAREHLERSEERVEIYARHAAYYLALAEEAEPELSGPEQAGWLSRLEEEHDNLRAALRWSTLVDGAEAGVPNLAGSKVKDQTKIQNPKSKSQNPNDPGPRMELGLRIAGALWRFWLVHGHYSEGRAQLAASLGAAEATLDPGTPGSRIQNQSGAYLAKALNGAAVMAWRQNDFDAASVLSAQALEIYRHLGDMFGAAQSLHNLGNVAHRHGDYAASVGYFTESLAARREAGDKHGSADSLNNLALVADEQGYYGRARTLYEESLALYRELGDKRGIANSLVNLGFVAWEQREHERARALYEESLPVYRELGDKKGIANALTNLGLVAWEQGDYETALSLFRESLLGHKDLGDRQGIAECLDGLARVAGSQGKARRAALLWGAAEALREAIGIAIPPGDVAEYEENVSQVRGTLDAAFWRVTWDQGRAAGLDQIIEYALTNNDEHAAGS